MATLLLIKKSLLFFVVTIVVAEFVILFPKDLADQTNVKLYRRTEDVKQYDQIAQDLHLMEVNQEKVEWELWSKRADKKTGLDIWGLNDVKAKFFGKNDHTFSVKGSQGTVSESRNQMQISGAVETLSSDGYQFKTDSILYDPVLHALISPGRVEMLGPADRDGAGIIVTGVGLRTLIHERKTEIQSDVYAVKSIAQQKPMSIRSSFAEFIGAKRIAQFSGDVVIKYGDMILTGPFAEFKLDGKQSQLDQLVMSKGVKMQDSFRKAVADKMTAYVQQNKIVLDGNPKVYQDQDVLVGDQILLLDGGERVQVVNVKAKFDSQNSQSSGRKAQ